MKTLLHILLSILLISFSGLSIDAQTTLQGVVIDVDNQSTIPFATIALYQNGTLITGTSTDFEGNYLFSNIDQGVYDVEAKFLGYATSRTEGVVVQLDSINRLDFQLEESGEILDEVIVTAYKVPLISYDQTSTGGTITAESIKKLPSKSICSLAARTAGLSTVNGSDISVRGARSNSTYIYIDGVRVNSNQTDLAKVNRKKKGKVSKKEKKLSKVEKKKVEAKKQQIESRAQYGFISPLEEPLSTMSIDVDKASYSNIRSYINREVMPPVDAVRVEEMVNYFDYDYNVPRGKHPFNVQSTLTDCPWNKKHQVMHIVIEANEKPEMLAKQSQFVFLIDVSGSMSDANKLPLVIESMKLLIDQMDSKDKVAIVTYAGRSGVVLPSTQVSKKSEILNALTQLTSGGSTAGADGIITAYKIASDNFIKNGNNRVILATDGDFNVGVSSEEGLVKLIEKKRESGVFLSVLGFGIGNYQDGKMQMLANKGNGNHAYIDSQREAKKILMTEYASTLFTIAKDVKIQIEFNPAVVQSYKLIGYENRRLNPEDFNNDKVDAGEMGIDHIVTALYEIIPVGVKSKYSPKAKVDDLVYQEVGKTSDHVGLIKMRYKLPSKSKSVKFMAEMNNDLVDQNELSSEIKFSLGVAEYGLLLSEFSTVHNGSYDNVLAQIEDGLSNDPHEERAEFETLVKQVQRMTASASID